jgi:hypothetical protein
MRLHWSSKFHDDETCRRMRAILGEPNTEDDDDEYEPYLRDEPDMLSD